MKLRKVSIILLAGGSGSRMDAPLPKQFMLLNNKPIVHYSCEIFERFLEAMEIIVVCNPSYHSLFKRHLQVPLKFAMPGLRRQDSVYNGFQAACPKAELICIHDAARPFITEELVSEVVLAAYEVGAAAAAVPVKSTIKTVCSSGFVKQTLDRGNLWEIQTPQVIAPKLLAAGFKIAIEKGLTVTDDVSLVELLGLPVKLVSGLHCNIKITTPNDLLFADQFAKGNL